MKTKGKRLIAFIIVLGVCFMDIARYANVILAVSYQSNEVVIETENLRQNGKTFINGIVKEGKVSTDIQAGIIRYLDSQTTVTDVYEWGGNEYQNNNAIYAKDKMTINAGKIQAKYILVAENDIILNASEIQTNGFSIIYSKKGNVIVHAGDVKWDGIIYAPNGTVEISASTIQVDGRIIAKNVQISAGVFEINGNNECNKIIDNLSFLTNDIDIRMSCNYDENTKKFNIIIDNEMGVELARKKVYVRYNDEMQFEELCELKEDEFMIPTDYECLDVVLKVETVFGVQTYTNIRSFQMSNEEFLYVKRDSDNDGIIDGNEILFTQTNPFLPDTDGDGFTDSEECFYLYTNPNEYTKDEDFDGDSLSNREELKKGTHPYLKDCDMDGILDGADEEPLMADGEVTTENIMANRVLPVGKYDKVINGFDEQGNAYQYVFDYMSNLVKYITYNNKNIYYFYDINNNKILDIRTVDEKVRANCLKYDGQDNVTAYFNNEDIYTYEYNEYDNIIKASINGQEISLQKENVLLYGNADELVVEGNQVYENEKHISTYEQDEENIITAYVDEENHIQYDYIYDKEGKLSKVASSTGFEIVYEYYDEYTKICYKYGDEIKEQIIYYDEEKDIEKTKTIAGFEAKYQVDAKTGCYCISNENGIIMKEIFSYDEENVTSMVQNDGTKIEYDYNHNNQISSIYADDKEIYRYEYNEIGQLEQAYDFQNNIIEEYRYDLYNNLLNSERYILKNNEKSEKLEEKEYRYGDDFMHDMLTSLNEESIEYDSIGNPINYLNDVQLEWFGKNLKHVVNKENDTEYTYDENGIRTSKTVNGNKIMYYLDGSNVIAEVQDNKAIWYIYDEAANVIGFIDNKKIFIYEKNATNDVEKILDENGSVVCTYEYDAWGNIIKITGDVTIAYQNPFRYKSYYYDNETGFYYLKTRYYDPQVGRFINMDDVKEVPYETIDANLYAYCGCDPVNLYDPYGKAAVKIAIYTAPEFGNEVLNYLMDDIEDTWQTYQMSTFSSEASSKAFANWWNSLKGVDVAFIDTHAQNDRLQANSHSVTSTAILDQNKLKKNNVKIVVLFGCNAGHFSFYTTNIASALAKKTTGVVVASDGTVAGVSYKNFLEKNIYYKSKNDETFKKFLRRNENRDNYGWLIYNGGTGHCYTLGTKKITVKSIYNLHKNNKYLIYK